MIWGAINSTVEYKLKKSGPTLVCKRYSFLTDVDELIYKSDLYFFDRVQNFFWGFVVLFWVEQQLADSLYGEWRPNNLLNFELLGLEETHKL